MLSESLGQASLVSAPVVPVLQRAAALGVAKLASTTLAPQQTDRARFSRVVPCDATSPKTGERLLLRRTNMFERSHAGGFLKIHLWVGAYQSGPAPSTWHVELVVVGKNNDVEALESVVRRTRPTVREQPGGQGASSSCSCTGPSSLSLLFSGISERAQAEGNRPTQFGRQVPLSMRGL